MKHKLLTAGVVVLILAFITMFNVKFQTSPVMSAQEREAQELQERLAANQALLEDDIDAEAETEAGAEAGAEVQEDVHTKSPDEVLGPDHKFPTAPDVFRVKFETSKGDVIVEARKEWAPLGVQRFHDLVKAGYFDGNRFFRVVPGFVVQWGMHGDPEVNEKWKSANLRDEPVRQGNEEGYLTFAKTQLPNTRSTQFFINLSDNNNLDAMGFSAFARVVEGMDVVRSLNSEYGESPNQGQIGSQGNAYLNARFPRLDYIKKATVIE